LVRADRVVAVSDAVKEWVGSIPHSKAQVLRIHNGIDSRAPEHRPGTSVRVAFVGRLNRWKGYEVFIEAVGRIADRHREATFILAGDPPAGEEHRSNDAMRQIEASGLAGRIQLLGFRSDVPELLAGIDVLVVPSTSPDPFPTVILEGMRAGCAVVASRHGGAPEMLTHGVDGLLVEPGDVGALGRQLERLLTDAGLRSSLGASARKRVQEQFGIRRFLDEWEQLYREVIAA
jgi:glycosyltransferase involved in cell wall biosynthesis